LRSPGPLFPVTQLRRVTSSSAYNEFINHTMKYHIKKTIQAGEYYLSPFMSRWLPVKSIKHRFGKFSKEDAEAFLEVKKKDNPETEYQLVPIK
jgi:hypothetical protein